ncbi:HK97 gp10 family phage protein [Methylobacter sp.]|uniref:HK97 gp10 family phage protein n=1 Tax=Methylobacter sp. TaxID=2051955 RepID=UPI002FDD71F9
MDIRLDLGNVPSVLAAFSDPQLAQRIVNAAAERYTDDTLDWIHAGHAFTTRNGQLEQSIGWHPNGNGSATVYVNADYAMYVEDGTQPHVIRPKDRKALRFPVGGGAGFGFARVINHPGSKAHPFFFADRDNRVDNMQAAAMSVLAHTMANQHG